MNKKSILAVIFIFTLLFAFQAFAADQGATSGSATDSGMSSGSSSSQPGMSGTSESAGSMSQMDKSMIVGKSVESSDGKKIGKISDVVSDPSSNQIAYAIVSYQGKNYPVPANALSMKSGDTLALNIDKDKFSTAPSLPAGQKPDINDQAMNSQVHQFYGVSPSWGAGTGGATGAPTTPSESGSGSMGGPSSGGSSGSKY